MIDLPQILIRELGRTRGMFKLGVEIPR